MKTFFVAALICLMAPAIFAQAPPATPAKHHHKAAAAGGTNNTASAESSQEAAAAAQAQQIALYQKSFIPNDPWRIMNDKTNYAKGGDWVQFEGTVSAVKPDGIVIIGWYGEPLGYLLPGYKSGMTFTLSHFPRHVVPGSIFSRNDRLVAFKSGTKNEMMDLDYGTVYVPQLTEEQKTAVTQARSQADARVLAFHQDLAAKGDPYGEYKMGLRYLTGDGVDKDVQKARDLLGKAAAQGNKDAADELAKIAATN